ncbi:hypothetical protein K438DRAFT_1934361 [Mycena galopus ATCC 62051]|nr:hypothetical protein K438DRAFT_1934361 [Mycena galopus ATCC 62051]
MPSSPLASAAHFLRQAHMAPSAIAYNGERDSHIREIKVVVGCKHVDEGQRACRTKENLIAVRSHICQLWDSVLQLRGCHLRDVRGGAVAAFNIIKSLEWQEATAERPRKVGRRQVLVPNSGSFSWI